jgi:type IV pilus assembly protein PilO
MVDLNKYFNQFKNLNPKDVGAWPIVPRVTAIIGLVLLVLVLGWYLYWSSLLDDLSAGQQEEARLKEDYKTKLQQAINLEPLRKQKELVSQYVFRLEKQLPSKAEMDALLSDINQAGVGRGLQFELFRPGQVTVKDYYAELPISLKLTGSYHDLGAFTSDIASLPRIVTLNNLSIVAPPTGSTPLTLEATAKTFRYLDAEEVAAVRKQQKAAKP